MEKTQVKLKTQNKRDSPFWFGRFNMPAKNAIKEYKVNSYYHIYNRGVEKRNIFCNKKDYQMFLYLLKIYLSPKDKSSLLEKIRKSSTWQEREKIIRLMKLNNYSQDIKLVAYCLMPNHFHLLVKQAPENGIQNFMRSLTSQYSLYFNSSNDRSGTLFQGRYKAVLVKSEEQLIYLSKYIHLNPSKKIKTWKYSSLSNYLGQINQNWVIPNEILLYFTREKLNISYLSFILKENKDFNLQDSLTID